MDLHHVGIATEDAAEAVALYADLLDCEVAYEERREGLAVTFLGASEPYLELLEPLDAAGEGPVERFLSRRGPGLHHLAFAVPDVEAALADAADAGIERIDETARSGAWDHEVAFLHPDSTGGVLVEFVG